MRNKHLMCIVFIAVSSISAIGQSPTVSSIWAGGTGCEGVGGEAATPCRIGSGLKGRIEVDENPRGTTEEITLGGPITTISDESSNEVDSGKVLHADAKRMIRQAPNVWLNERLKGEVRTMDDASSTGASGQSPAITGIWVQDTDCRYFVGKSAFPCRIGPGMKVSIQGSGFTDSGNVSLCDCALTTIQEWTSDEITVVVDVVSATGALSVETTTGAYSNPVKYSALLPVITSIDVGTCTFIPGESTTQCAITPGTQFTIHGKFFGPGGAVATCECSDATIISWNPNWATKPSPINNTIVAIATDALPGSMIQVFTLAGWGNTVPYTTCGN